MPALGGDGCGSTGRTTATNARTQPTSPEIRRAEAAQDADSNPHLAGEDACHEPETGSAFRVERALEHRANVDAVNRAYAIDQGYARVQEIEAKTVTPAMRRIEAEDPDRTLVGLEHRLKGKERLSEKIVGRRPSMGSYRWRGVL